MFKVEVRVRNEQSFNSNALRFETREEAESYAKDLYSRWIAVEEYRLVEMEKAGTDG